MKQYLDNNSAELDNNKSWSNVDATAPVAPGTSTTGMTATQIADLIQKGAVIVGGVVQNRQAQTAATGCKKPLLPESFVNRAAWSTYKDCMAKNSAPVQSPVYVSAPAPTAVTQSFFSTTAGKVTIGVGAIILVLGGVVAYKKFKG